MRSSAVRGFAIGGLVLGLGACKGNVASPAPDGSSPHATAATACADLFDALTRLVGCGATGFAGLAPKDRFVAYCQARVGAPGADAAPDAAERCVATVRASVSGCSGVDLAACAYPLGTRKAGEPCGTALQCASGYCAGPGSTSQDGWPVPSFLGLGAPSMSPEGLTSCGVCVDTIAQGQACVVSTSECGPGCSTIPVPCAAGAFCAPAGGGAGASQTGTCGAPVAAVGTTGVCDCEDAAAPKAGQPCAAAVNGTGCAPSLACDPTTHTCVAVTYAAPGAGCDGNTVQCGAGLCSFANKKPSSLPGTCPLAIADGASCVPGALDAVCGSEATCTTPAGPNGCCAPGGAGGGPASSADGGLPQEDAGAGPTCVLFDPTTCG